MRHHSHQVPGPGINLCVCTNNTCLLLLLLAMVKIMCGRVIKMLRFIYFFILSINSFYIFNIYCNFFAFCWYFCCCNFCFKPLFITFIISFSVAIVIMFDLVRLLLQLAFYKIYNFREMLYGKMMLLLVYNDLIIIIMMHGK